MHKGHKHVPRSTLTDSLNFLEGKTLFYPLSNIFSEKSSGKDQRFSDAFEAAWIQSHAPVRLPGPRSESSARGRDKSRPPRDGPPEGFWFPSLPSPGRGERLSVRPRLRESWRPEARDPGLSLSLQSRQDTEDPGNAEPRPGADSWLQRRNVPDHFPVVSRSSVRLEPRGVFG